MSADKAQPIAKFPTLIDLVKHDGKLGFLVIDDNGLPAYVREYTGPNGEKWVPPRTDSVPFRVIPRRDKVLALTSPGRDLSLYDPALFRDVRQYLAQSAVPPAPEEGWLDLFTAWVFHTYAQEHIPYTPYICFFGVPERGKTRLGKALTYLAYRGYHTVSLRQPMLFRMAQNFGATIFLDIMDLWNRARGANCEDILLLRYEAGATVDRVQNAERGAFNDTSYYEIFGPTIIATNEPVNRILETRCIPVSMPDATGRDLGPTPTPDSALEVRERLTAWRGRLVALRRQFERGVLPTVSPAVPGRLGDVTRCLSQIAEAVDPDRREGIESVIRQLALRRQETKAGSWEGEIVATLVKSRNLVVSGKLPVAAITQKVNEHRDRQEALTPQKIGKTLRALGVETVRIKGCSHVAYDRALIAKLAESWCTPDERLWTAEKTVHPENTTTKPLGENVDFVEEYGSGLDSHGTFEDAPPPPTAKAVKLPTRDKLQNRERTGSPEGGECEAGYEAKAPPNDLEFEEGAL